MREISPDILYSYEVILFFLCNYQEQAKNCFLNVIISVAEMYHFYAAQAPGTFSDAAPVPTSRLF
jgi:hypothetical protein